VRSHGAWRGARRVAWYSAVQRTRRGIGGAWRGMAWHGAARPFPMIVGFCVPRQKEIGAARVLESHGAARLVQFFVTFS